MINIGNDDKEQRVDNSNKYIATLNFWRSQKSMTMSSYVILTRTAVTMLMQFWQNIDWALTHILLSKFWHNVVCWHNNDHFDSRLTSRSNVNTILTHTHCCHNSTKTWPGECETAWMRATKTILKVVVCYFLFVVCLFVFTLIICWLTATREEWAGNYTRLYFFLLVLFATYLQQRSL